MDTERPKVVLNQSKEQSLLRKHPWVFSGAIKKIIADNEPAEGEIVDVVDSKENFLATGHFQTGSIAVRLFSFIEGETDQKFWNSKIQNAYNYRKQIGLIDDPNTNVYRLLYAEGDGMPGMIIDFYNGTAVLQSHSTGMHLAKEHIVKALKDIYKDKLHAVYDKSEESMPKLGKEKTRLPDGQVKNGYLFGKADTNEVVENGHKFFVDWETGQKTGFFIDQRDNRQLLAKYSKEKKILNTFCYSGGFSVYAAVAGAELVHSVDSSKKAIELTDKNINLNAGNFNGVALESFTADTFDFLHKKHNQYDVIILDPPAFAKNRNATHNAINGYKRLNTEAIKQIKPGGMLFTFSCSQVISPAMFHGAIRASAIIAGRNARIVHQLSHPADHPISIFHPEGEYLKGLVVQVE